MCQKAAGLTRHWASETLARDWLRGEKSTLRKVVNAANRYKTRTDLIVCSPHTLVASPQQIGCPRRRMGMPANDRADDHILRSKVAPVAVAFLLREM
jgi:hypothetical protein